MANNETFAAEIKLNSQDAVKKIKELTAELEREKQALNAMTKEGSETSKKAIVETQKRINELGKEIDNQNRIAKGLNQTIQELSNMSYKELQKTIRALNKELRSGNIEKGSQLWEEYSRKIRACKAEIEKFNEATTLQKGKLSKMFDFLNKNWGAFTQLIGVITGLSVTIRKSVSDYAEMEQEMANVRKYTGQTEEEVRKMNESFKAMDTRTSREELNQLAGAAGRLGLTAEEDIKEFVDAADQIGVALGDDLGDGAVDTIGKLAIAFGESDRLGLRGAMLATGSALNEIVQNSSAQAQPVVEFTKALSGVGQQAHMSQAEIMGFASALDQNNQEMATSSTVMSQLITKMYEDPAKFAKMAGLEVQDFANLVKTDMNEALMTWFEATNQLGDMSVLAGAFDTLGMDGTRAVGVLSTLAGHIDQVAEAQRIANEAYTEATSVSAEYNIQNNTVQAGVDKAKKQFKEMAIELGEKLLPVVQYTISGTSLLTKGLSTLVGFVLKHTTAIVTLTASIAAYTIAVNASTIAFKLHYAWLVLVEKAQKAVQTAQALGKVVTTGLTLAYERLVWQTKGATAAQQNFNKALKAAGSNNVIGLVITMVAALGVALYKLYQRVQQNQEAARTLKKIKDDALVQAQEEITKVNTLVAAARNEKLSLDERKKAINALNRIIPGYNGQLDATTKKYRENTVALKNYIAQLVRKYEIEGAKKAIQKAAEEIADLRIQEGNAKEELKSAEENQKQIQESMRNADGTPRPQTSGGAVAPSNVMAQGSASVEVSAARGKISDIESKISQKQRVIDSISNVYGKDIQQITIKEVTIEEQTENEGGGGGSHGSHSSGSGGGGTHNGGTNDDKDDKNDKTDADKERKKAIKQAAEDAKAEYQAELAEEMAAYRQGVTTYSDYINEKHNLTVNYYNKMKSIYGADSDEYKKLLDDKERAENEYYQMIVKMAEDKITTEKVERDHAIQMQFLDQTNKETYQNQELLNENLFKSEIAFMRQKQNLYYNGSKEWEELEQKIKEAELQHKFELEENYQKKLVEYRREFSLMSADELEQIELQSVKTMYETLVAEGKMTEEEYLKILQKIKGAYAEMKAEQSSDSDIKNKGSKALETARKSSGYMEQEGGSGIASIVGNAMSAVEQQKKVNDALDELYKEGAIDYETYEEAKRQNAKQTSEIMLSSATAAVEEINNMLSSVSSYMQACSDLETAKITANYDKQIEAAGNNSKKVEKLEEERDEKIRKAKTAANKKAMAIEMAQAVASTAMAAINAYASAAEIPVTGWIMAPIAAGLATAAGMLQIATIKKQHQAEELGYYSGGFTGGNRYKKEAGVVHEGEFVANHEAVNNSNIAPVFDLLDKAQKNNKVGSLTSQDVTNVMGGPASTAIVPIVNVQSNNDEIKENLDGVSDAVNLLSDILSEPIEAKMSMQDFDRDYKRYKNLLNSK